MRTLLLTLLLTATALAGCTSDSPMDGEPTVDTDGDGIPDAPADPLDEGPPILYEAVNPWDDGQGGNLSEIVLFDDTVDLAWPTVGSDAVPRFCFWAVVAVTCHVAGGFDLPEGTIIPPGTSHLHIEATRDYDSGGGWMIYPSRTYGRSSYDEDGASLIPDPTTESSGAWYIPLLPADWDLPFLVDSSSYFLVGLVDSDPVVLHGSIDVTVTAIRDPDWVPEPIHDPWPDLDPAAMPQENVTTRLDATVDLVSGDFGYAWVDFPSSFPLGTDAVVVGATWTLDACQPPMECLVDIGYYDRYNWIWYDDVETWEIGDDYTVFVIPSPEQTWPAPDKGADADYGYVDAWASFCPTGFCAYSYEGTGSVRFLVEAWRGEVDMDAFKERLGVT